MDTVDEYISQFSGDVKDRLDSVRNIVREAAPEAAEKVSWQMPTFTLNGILIQFAAFKQHISLFPGPDCIAAFEKELSGYKTSKGTIQFQNSLPLPYDLIKRIAGYKTGVNRNKGKKR